MEVYNKSLVCIQNKCKMISNQNDTLKLKRKETLINLFRIDRSNIKEFKRLLRKLLVLVMSIKTNLEKDPLNLKDLTATSQ